MPFKEVWSASSLGSQLHVCTCMSLNMYVYLSSKQAYIYSNTGTKDLPSFLGSCKVNNVHQSPAQFSRLGIQASLAIMCLFVWAMVGWVTLPFFQLF